MSEFENPEVEEKTLFDNLLNKVDSFLDKEHDTDDVVNILQQMLFLQKQQNKEILQNNFIHKSYFLETNAVGGKSVDLIKCPQDHFLKIHKILFTSLSSLITISLLGIRSTDFSSAFFYKFDNILELNNLYTNDNQDFNLNCFNTYVSVEQEFSVHITAEFVRISDYVIQ